MIKPMPQVVQPKRRRWTRAEYYRMADLGMFAGQRVELVGGEIVEMSAQKDTHVIAVALADEALSIALGTGFWVRIQAPLNLSIHDDPEPDLAVVAGAKRDYIGSANRVKALLVVEVSDTTLRFDRGKKARRYARARIADYWIVNLPAQQVEVYRDPALRDGRYLFAPPLIFKRGQSIIPLAAPNSAVKVDDLLP
ncbi:MAG TPA: Uma2 family endonuclease [Tepidisphaeraceae bacterium]|jgi:Uma2 family endonuclease|nr:Uma2 family endonuclease [Tepidisphaeraceae bacterium]